MALANVAELSSPIRPRPITTAPRTPRPVSVAETVTVGLPPDTLARLAAASEVTGTLGSTAFRFTPEQLLAVRALAQRLEGR